MKSDWSKFYERSPLGGLSLLEKFILERLVCMLRTDQAFSMRSKSASLVYCSEEKRALTMEDANTTKRRIHLKTLLEREQQGAAPIEQRIDVEMRLMLSHYDELEQQRVQLLGWRKPDQGEQRSYENDRILKSILTEEQILRSRLEFAGELQDIDGLVIAACLSTIAWHHLAEQDESSFEHGYSLLQNYFMGTNTLPFSQLGFFTKEEVFELLGIEQQDSGTPENAHEKGN